MIRFPRIVFSALLFAAGVSAHAATVVPLNDTGQALCYDSSGNSVSCATSKDDGNYGRDAANTAGALSKTGAGNAGFDFTKIANNGTVLAAGAALGSNPTDWACTKDNVTSLTWEVKTTSGLRSSANSYTWYSSDSTSNGGNVGDNTDTITCGGTLASCNTQDYISAVNTAVLCGYSDWRMPSLKELKSLVDFSVISGADIDANYFPNTQTEWFWSANNNSSNPAFAWVVYLDGGGSVSFYKANGLYVRLVRGGQ